MTILHINNHITDTYQGLLESFLSTVDSEWDHTATESHKYPPEDAMYIERLDDISGLGFTVCQRYMASAFPSFGLSKKEALDLPPFHSSGTTVVALINSGANFWKHSDEWIDENHEYKKEKTLGILRTALSEAEIGSCCSNLVSALVGDSPQPFSRILKYIMDWRSHLINRNDNKAFLPIRRTRCAEV